MRICHVITRLIVGGAQENTVLTCRGLVERGHEVTLIAGPETGPEGSLWDDARRAGCSLIPLESLRRAVRPWQDLRALRTLRAKFLELQPDIVHTHSSKAGILARAAAFDAGVPCIVHTIHGMSFNRTQPWAVRTAYQAVERWAAERTHAFITVADAMIEQSVAARIAPREKFVTIRSGLETERFTPNAELRQRFRAEWGVAEDEIVVGTVARLFQNKGYEEILDAMPRAIAAVSRAGGTPSSTGVSSPSLQESNPARRLCFVWIGDGAYRSRYERRLDELGLRDRVRLLGLLRPDEVAERINGFDIALHASKWEGLPRALVQALLTEVPAISFDIDGAPEVVTPNETGLLVPLGDTTGLATAIVRLANDADLRRAMGRRGRERCFAEFDWRRMVRKIESVYDRTLSPG